MDVNAARLELGRHRARERELGVLRGRVQPGRPCARHGAGHGDDVHDVRRPRRLERRQEGAQAPDPAEVVDADDVLDPLRLRVEEACAARDARVVHEQADPRMAGDDPRRPSRSTASRSPTSHVSCSAPSSSATRASRSAPRATSTHCQPRAVSSLASAAPMPLEPPVTTATAQRQQTRTRRRASASRPAVSETMAVSSCGPFLAPPVRQIARKIPWLRLPDARHLSLPVVEADRGDRRRRGGGDGELGPARHARASRRRDPRHDRAGDDREASAEEAGVRHRLVARGRDVLRLLEVAGHDPHELGAGEERLRVLRDREHGDARLRIVAHAPRSARSCRAGGATADRRRTSRPTPARRCSACPWRAAS